MTMEADPYQLLGVTPETGPEDIRRAFREAALKHHPDSNPDRPDEAARKFRDVTAAYHWLMRRAQRIRAADDRRPAYTPQDFFRQGMGWDSSIWPGPRPSTTSRPPQGRFGQKMTYPRINENVVFVCCWVVAVLLATLVTGWLSDPPLAPARSAADSFPDQLLALAASVGTYVLVLTATIWGLTLTRKVVWRIVEWGLAWRRALPGPKSREPLPRRRWWRLGK